MTRRLFLTALAVLLTAATLHSQTPAGEEPKPTPLTEHMEKMESALRTLRKQIGDPAQNPASLELVVNMQEIAVQAKRFAPHKAEKLPEADRPAFIKRYRIDLADLVVRLQELELSLLDNKNDQAQEALAQILKIRFDAHREFKGAPRG